jgi:hypothetical protein
MDSMAVAAAAETELSYLYDIDRRQSATDGRKHRIPWGEMLTFVNKYGFDIDIVKTH